MKMQGLLWSLYKNDKVKAKFIKPTGATVYLWKYRIITVSLSLFLQCLEPQFLLLLITLNSKPHEIEHEAKRYTEG